MIAFLQALTKTEHRRGIRHAGSGPRTPRIEELQEVTDVLSSHRLSRFGPNDGSFPAKVLQFEREVCRRSGAEYALAVNSGTSGLIVALLALGVGPGDEVIVPGFTFVATMSSVVYAGALPVLAEIDDTLNLDPASVDGSISPRTKAIIAVHMLGNPARLAELQTLAAQHGLPLIEDAAQAFGATYGGDGSERTDGLASTASMSTRRSRVVTEE